MPRLAVGAAAVLLAFAAAFAVGRATRSSGDDGAVLPRAAQPASPAIAGLSTVVALPALRVTHHAAAAPSKRPTAPSSPAPASAPPPAPASSPAPRPAVAPTRPAPRPAPKRPAPDRTIIGGGGGG